MSSCFSFASLEASFPDTFGSVPKSPILSGAPSVADTTFVLHSSPSDLSIADSFTDASVVSGTVPCVSSPGSEVITSVCKK